MIVHFSLFTMNMFIGLREMYHSQAVMYGISSCAFLSTFYKKKNLKNNNIQTKTSNT